MRDQLLRQTIQNAQNCEINTHFIEGQQREGAKDGLTFQSCCNQQILEIFRSRLADGRVSDDSGMSQLIRAQFHGTSDS